MSQTITVPTVGVHTGFIAVQTYTYDSLNRINDAIESTTPHGGSASQSWKQAFVYDRYGNRNFDEEETTTLPKNCGSSPNFTVCAADKKIVNPAINTTNNRLSTSDDYVFDSVGNTTEDAQGRTFIYDAENKQVEVKDQYDTTIGEYFYDGDGKRIKKIVPSTGEVTVFVYSANGQLIAEYSTVQSQAPKVSYTTADHLGSPRILTDENGATISRRDFHPFGEEIATAERIVALGYQADDVRQKFTTYERDTETDLDFAQARTYNSGLARFMSTDPIYLKKDRLNDPQRLSLYIYVRNSPTVLDDPTGLDFEFKGKDKEKFEGDINNRDKAAFKVRLNEDGILEVVNVEKVNPKKLSKRERDLFDAINDKEHRAVIVGIDANPLIDFDGFSGPFVLASDKSGLNFVDTTDMSLLRDADTSAAGEMIGHAMMEAYAAATTGSSDYATVHAMASKHFPEPGFGNAESLPGEKGKPVLSGYSAVWTWKTPKKDISVKVTYTFVTPIPRASIVKQPRGNITNIELVDKK
ncbi:MAG: hypothetical protein KF855_03120 [Acidobacteria bacterium]|nr:hypothetical protein [Acidobacteriota bacterium]